MDVSSDVKESEAQQESTDDESDSDHEMNADIGEKFSKRHTNEGAFSYM